MTKFAQISIANAKFWDIPSPLQDDVKSELKHWKNYFSLPLRGAPISERKEIPANCLCVYTDASEFGGGGFIQNTPNSQVFFAWDSAAQTSSTYRELLAFYETLMAVGHLLKNRNVIWFCDNQNAVRIVNTGSMKLDLHKLACKLRISCTYLNLNLFSKWIPRKLNYYADRLSRIVDTNDYVVNPHIFNYFDHLWGPHSCDRFADDGNTKCPRFNSAVNCVGSEGIDAFNFNWGGENNWLVPPVHLAPKTIIHAKNCKAKGTLVVPKWHSAPFWPLLHDGESFLPCVKGHMEYKNPTNFFVSGRNKLFTENLKFNMLVIRLDFS